MHVDPLLQMEIESIYARYAEALDDGPLEAWPNFFTDVCMYQLIPRDNVELGYPLAVIRCESRDMLRDRVSAVQETMMYEPRYLRHHITNILLREHAGNVLHVSANYSINEVLADELPRLFMIGRYLDTLEYVEGTWLFREKRCVFDSTLVPNSIIYPV
jgi:3-phenylpropionate/cinnamic acid dioxygenase small subunit